jgi:hypothetical protein
MLIYPHDEQDGGWDFIAFKDQVGRLLQLAVVALVAVTVFRGLWKVAEWIWS